MRSRVLLLLFVRFSLHAQEPCAKCHASIHQQWAASLHGRIMQPAARARIEADFSQAKVLLHGATYLLARRGADLFVTESDLSGKPVEHRVDYVLGSRRIQHYLTTLPDGRIIVLPPSWDNQAKKWIHDLDVHNPEESPSDLVPVWNKTCYSCHVSQPRKNFDAAQLSYRTAWRDPGANCETCHGPGAAHVARPTRANIVNPARLDAARSVAVCAQCHSARDIYAESFQAGSNYLDAFMPVMEYRVPSSGDPAFWADGRPRWFANESAALWESRCFLQGKAACVTCHKPSHNDIRQRSVADASCVTCHRSIAANPAAHTHHAAGSAGSSCVECHMPAITTGLNARMRDHSMSVPVPENTLAHDTPNACNLCHTDRDAAWSTRHMTAWWGAASRRPRIERADAFTQARHSDPAAIPALLRILADQSAGGWMRANAAGWLGAFPGDPAAYDAVLRAFTDPDPLVRATAASAIRPRAAQREALAPQLVSLLKDPVLDVRMNAGIALVSMGVRPFPGEDGARFEQAKEIYRARAELDADDAGQQFAAGKFFFLAGDAGRAAAAFRLAMRLDPAIPAQFLLGRSLAVRNDLPAARAILEKIQRDNPDYAAAQQLLAELEAKGPATAGADARAQFLDGQVKLQSQYYAAALQAFDQALKLAPQAEWALQARIDRAICLEKLSRAGEAEAEMQALLANPEARRDVDLQLAYVELLSDAGRIEDARKQAEAVAAEAPNSPLAHFWRAKVLLQLNRTADAAAAAEESVRLQPQLPQAHNLLVRIYQMQGRTKEAAQQAEWLREYQRRTQSH